MKRKDMLAASVGALATGGALGAGAQAAIVADAISRDTSTLVLPGGGARGAYEAGVIEGLRQSAGIADGAALPGVNAVAGTSIGAINGWFVATGQYSLLAEIWRTVASQNIFRVKKKYAATVTPSSGVLTRVFQAALISQGLTTNVTGLLDGAPIRAWLERNIEPSAPLVTNFLFTLTNLNRQRAEVFYRTQILPTAAQKLVATARLRSIFGKSLALREIEDTYLVAALAGSSAIPILLDPVTIDFADGAQSYIDGGVADSAPLDLARAFSNRVALVLVDPERPAATHFANAAAIGSAAFTIAQNRVLEASLRAAYRETQIKHLFRLDATTEQQRAFLQDSFDVRLDIIRPERELPVAVGGFDDAEGIAKTYEFGRQAGLRGFRPYDPGSVID